MPFPRTSRSGRSPHCSDAKSVPVRPKPVATSSQMSKTSFARHAAPSAARPSRSASCIPAAPWTSGSTITAASSDACPSTSSRAVSKQRGSAKDGARTTGNRSGSKRSVPKPSSPTDSAPMVSPWYAPPNARNVVRPRMPRFTQYWNAIFNPCSTADAPSDANRKCGSSTGTTAPSASQSSMTTRLPLPSIVECAPRSSCARTASSSSTTRWPSVFTHNDDMASR